MRRRIRRSIFWLAITLIPHTLSAASEDLGLETIRAAALKGHVYFLASDEMAGRDSLSPEGRIAAQYIASFFHRVRLAAVGDDATNFQNFPMVEARVDTPNVKLRASSTAPTGGIAHKDFILGSDFTLLRHRVPMVLFNTGEHPDYHTANDTWDRINYPKMEKIVRLVYLTARHLADSDERPDFVTDRTSSGPSSR